MDQQNQNGQDMRSTHDAGESQANSSKVFPVVVYTPKELEAAQKNGAERIIVKGDMAAKLETALKTVRSIGGKSLNALALIVSGAALLAPFTGGVSLGAAGTVMGTLGAAVTAAAIAAISAIGLSLVVAVFKGYDEVKLGGGGLELVIKKHGSKSDKQEAEKSAATRQNAHAQDEHAQDANKQEDHAQNAGKQKAGSPDLSDSPNSDERRAGKSAEKSGVASDSGKTQDEDSEVLEQMAKAVKIAKAARKLEKSLKKPTNQRKSIFGSKSSHK